MGEGECRDWSICLFLWLDCVLVRQLHSCSHPWRAALGPFVLLSLFGQGSRTAALLSLRLLKEALFVPGMGEI